MKVYKVTDKEFSEFGRVLYEYDFGEFVAALEKCEAPSDKVKYVASIKELEDLKIFDEFKTKGFAGMPIQIGCTSGYCTTMNALEYHKASEFNIATVDTILILGKQTDIVDGKYDTSLCKAFFLPAWRPDKAMNLEKPEFVPTCPEEEMCCGANKWLLAHPDSPEAKQGRFIGLVGKNYTIEDMEF